MITTPRSTADDANTPKPHIVVSMLPTQPDDDQIPLTPDCVILAMNQPREKSESSIVRILRGMRLEGARLEESKAYAGDPHYLITSLPHYLITSLPHYLITSFPHFLISSFPHFLKPQTSNLKPQTSNLKPQTSNLKPQASNLLKLNHKK